MVSLDDLMAEIGGAPAAKEEKKAEKPTVAEKAPEVVEEAPAVEETSKAEPEEVKDPLEGLVIGAEDVPAPEPVKKRGRPKGSTAKKAAKVEEKTPEPETQVEQTPVQEPEVVNSIAVDNSTPDVAADWASEAVVKAEVKSKDIYILTDSQIINGHPYRRGQKITFTPGDKFYNSQTDRNGNNWLDYVDDPEAQFAYFGKLIVEPDQWTGIPLGSVEGINHPGIALAISRYAQEEFKRNGVPFN